jgi:NAD(P)-dependent dehydrogenase (short-subunit alcohol dehydrogenase family)
LGQKGIAVWLGSRDAAKGEAAAAKLRQEGIDATAIAIDVTDETSVQSAVKTIEAKHGKLDILVNNAGVFLDWGTSPLEVSEETIRETFETNFYGPFRVTRAFLPLLRKSSEARVVNLSSVLGSLSLTADPTSQYSGLKGMAYQTSKAALNMQTVALSNELKPAGIKVNAAHPGWVKTDMGGAGAQLEVPEGATTSVTLATLDANGPTGGYFHQDKAIAW